jgi:hypothetical protein
VTSLRSFVCVYAYSGRLASSFWSPPRGVLLKIEPTTHRRLRSETRREQNTSSTNPTSSSTSRSNAISSTTRRNPSRTTPNSRVPVTTPPPSLSPFSILATDLQTALRQEINKQTPNTDTTSSTVSTLTPSISEEEEEIAPMAQIHVMPIRGERSAPTFDPTSPNDITRFFRQLETLFARCTVADDTEKKQHATSYVSSEVADSWEALTEFTDPLVTFLAFKNRLFVIYNQVSLRYILSDLDRIIGERQRLGVRSLQDLSEFHLRFNAISTYLIANDLLSSREQSQSYLRVFDEGTQSQITMRLQIKLPNHHPSLPYPINEVYEAAKWVLQGVPGSLGLPLSAASAPPTTHIANTTKRISWSRIHQNRTAGFFSKRFY